MICIIYLGVILWCALMVGHSWGHGCLIGWAHSSRARTYFSHHTAQYRKWLSGPLLLEHAPDTLFVHIYNFGILRISTAFVISSLLGAALFGLHYGGLDFCVCWFSYISWSFVMGARKVTSFYGNFTCLRYKLGIYLNFFHHQVLCIPYVFHS